VVEEGTAVHGRLDTAPGSVEKSHTERLLQAGNGRGHDGLREERWRAAFAMLPHCDREQHMQVAQFERRPMRSSHCMFAIAIYGR
jgi:hypothetical protein